MKLQGPKVLQRPPNSADFPISIPLGVYSSLGKEPTTRDLIIRDRIWLTPINFFVTTS